MMAYPQQDRLRRLPDKPMLLSSGGKVGGGAKTSGLVSVASLALLAGLRVGLLQPDLWFNLCAIALPIALLASIVASVHFDPVGRRT